MQLLLLLVLEGRCDDAHTFISNSIASEIQLSNSLAALQDTFKLVKTIKSNIILFESEDLQVALLTEGTSESESTLREDTIA